MFDLGWRHRVAGEADEIAAGAPPEELRPTQREREDAQGREGQR